MSSYSNPDYSELNYHVGTAARCEIGLLETIHLGVQASKENTKAEILTAILLLHICRNPTADLAKLRIDLEKGLPQLTCELQGNDALGSGISTASKDYRKTVQDTVQLYCYCQTPWVDRSTSAALHGKSQRDFNMYNCSVCNNWFHKYCLITCGITIPKRNADFICNGCSVPESLPWSHDEFTNTCTSDNFLSILLLHCKQYKSFLDTFGDSEVENSLKAAITLMDQGKLCEGKTLFLHMAQRYLNLSRTNMKYDCFGGENNKCLCLFTHVWKLVIKAKCTSRFCPSHTKEVTKHPSTFSFAPTLDNLDELFPTVGSMVGYCGAEFHFQPQKGAPYAITDRLDITGKKKKIFNNAVESHRSSHHLSSVKLLG